MYIHMYMYVCTHAVSQSSCIEWCILYIVHAPIQIDLEQVYELNRRKFVPKSSRRTQATPKEKVVTTYMYSIVQRVCVV